MDQFIECRVECSKCKSADHEYVTYSGAQFVRCRSCGHEGEKKSLLPPTGTSCIVSAIAKRIEDQAQKF